MHNHILSLSLPKAEAAQCNRNLMQEFQAALEKDPTVDLISIIPDSYHREHHNAQFQELSYAAQINLRTINELYQELEIEPEANLLSLFPKNYNRRIQMATGSRTAPSLEQSEIQGPPEFRTRLDLADTATVVFPLSEKTTTLLTRYSEGSGSASDTTGESLAVSLKKLLWDSPVLWEFPVRGVVVKCSEEVVAKIITGHRDYTEYTSMQYLEEKASDIPAPRPHGLIALGPFRVIFMSYIPEITLATVWDGLTPQEKRSIQDQLDVIFVRLRNLRQDDGDELGGVCGEGVKEYNVDETALWKGITRAKEYNDLQFTARHHGSNTYVELLRSFLDTTAMRGSVFTHGDIRKENIMVKRDSGSRDSYVVTGIIDWEDSGFYPEYYECTTLTGNLSLVEEDDWYLYLPSSIAPSRFPINWLVDRLWKIHLRTT
ncbi:hypothetical protein DTO271D3_7246 [Paecilomyces variotii]|nr:hypothetical protein DTO271D3_7246 [Paecilomyces variotii]